MINYLFEDVPEQGEMRQVVDGIYWLRMPLPMALDHINLYLLEDDDGWWVVDTGIAVGATEEIWEKVLTTSLQGKPVKAVIATHCHPDHIGMAGWLCERFRVPLYMTQGEYMAGLVFSRTTAEHFSWTSEQHLRRCGYQPEQIERARKHHGGFGFVIKPMPTAFQRLEDGMRLTINGRHWRIVVGHGHSPEHACLFSESLNVLVSGDQVIPRITSNVSVQGNQPNANPLREWLQSHERLLEELPADALVLPAHNAPFYGLHYRLRYLIEHHEDHLLALEEACVEGDPCAMELLPVLFARELDENHVGLAVGECVAHLNYLHQRGQLDRFEDEMGCYRYRSTDDTLPMRRREQRHAVEADPPIQV